MPAGSGAVIVLPSGVCQRSQRKFTTCRRIIRSCTTKSVWPFKREPCGGAATLTIRSSWIDSFDRVLPRPRRCPPERSGGFGSVALSMPLGLIFGRPDPAFERGDLVALCRNRPPQFGHLFQELQHQALQIGLRKAMRFDTPEDRFEHRAAGPHLVGQGRQAERHTFLGVAVSLAISRFSASGHERLRRRPAPDVPITDFVDTSRPHNAKDHTLREMKFPSKA